MRSSAVSHFNFEWSHHIETDLAKWRVDVDARGRKWRHELSLGSFEPLLASDAVIDRHFRSLKALENPKSLSELAQDVFWTGMGFSLVGVANQLFDVGVVSWEDGWEFGFLRQSGSGDAAADAD